MCQRAIFIAGPTCLSIAFQNVGASLTERKQGKKLDQGTRDGHLFKVGSDA